MKKSPSSLTLEYVNECFIYDSETGVFTWKNRPLSHFKTETSRSILNTRYAGYTAGCSARNYIFIKVSGIKICAHWLAWFMYYGAWPNYPKEQIDHLDKNGNNNSINNLRAVPSYLNMRNQKRHVTNTSGVTGVTWDKSRGKWAAQVTMHNIKQTLGAFSTVEEARDVLIAFRSKNGFTEGHGHAPLTLEAPPKITRKKTGVYRSLRAKKPYLATDPNTGKYIGRFYTEADAFKAIANHLNTPQVMATIFGTISFYPA